MTYLVAQTALFLIAAAILGFGVGWLIRHSRARLGIQRERADWEIQFERLRSERDTAVASSEADRTRAEALSADIDKHRKRQAHLDEDIEPMRQSLDELRESKLRWEKERSDTKAWAQTIQDALDEAERDRDRARNELGELQKVVQSSSRSLNFLKEKSQSTETMRRELYQSLHEAQKEAERANKDAEQARAESQTLKRELDALRRRYEELERLGDEGRSEDGPLHNARSLSTLSSSADLHTLEMALQSSRSRIEALEAELLGVVNIRKRLAELPSDIDNKDA